MKYAKWVPETLRSQSDEALRCNHEWLADYDSMRRIILSAEQGGTILDSFPEWKSNSITIEFINMLAYWMMKSVSRPSTEQMTGGERSDKIASARTAIKTLKLILPSLGEDWSVFDRLPSDMLNRLILGSLRPEDEIWSFTKLFSDNPIPRDLLLENGSVTELLGLVDKSLDCLESEYIYIPQPNHENADRNYFIRKMHDFFIGEFNRPLVPTIAKIAQLVFDDSTIDTTKVNDHIQKHRRALKKHAK